MFAAHGTDYYKSETPGVGGTAGRCLDCGCESFEDILCCLKALGDLVREKEFSGSENAIVGNERLQ